jgi:hypothetical protein
MMFALLALVAGLAGPAPAASAPPARLCGGADLVRGNVSMILRILNVPTDLHSPYVGARARNADGSYSLSVGYRPTKKGLGRPHIVHVDALAPFASEAEVRPLRLEWRAPGEAWTNPKHWSEPQRHFPKEEARYATNYRLGQGLPHPHGTEVLDNLAKGVRYEFRSVDEAGRVVASGSADYPPQRVMEEMYATARKQALARLKPCSTGRAPSIVPVAPPLPPERR